MAATVPEPVVVPEVKEDIEDEKEEPELILEVNRTIFFFFFFFMFAPMVGNCSFTVFHFNRMKKNSRKKS